ncbi:hypothetical protein [Microvirga massiliensis]|uniref:hypothetical protein n=1 Tax=Microvirga massiliensis TaxID=1033741 RepID=UPI00062B8A15|nr:hypothetical protein [Microvirga massiliensis]
MASDPEKSVREQRQRIAAEGLPKLSEEALRSARRRGARSQQAPVLLPRKVEANSLVLSEEARRLYFEKSNPD